MKHNYFLFLLVLLLFNCSSDNDNETQEDESISGTWKLTSYTFENSYDFNKDGISSNNFMLETTCFDNVIINLNDDGSGEEIATTQLEFTFPSPNEYTMNCLSSTIIDDSIIWNQDEDILTVQGSIQGFIATIDGDTFSFTRNANQLVQALFGSSHTDNETLIYTKQ